MTFESSYDAVFAAEAMRKYRMFKKKESKINARGKEKRRANYAERIFFFFINEAIVQVRHRLL